MTLHQRCEKWKYVYNCWKFPFPNLSCESFKNLEIFLEIWKLSKIFLEISWYFEYWKYFENISKIFREYFDIIMNSSALDSQTVRVANRYIIRVSEWYASEGGVTAPKVPLFNQISIKLTIFSLFFKFNWCQRIYQVL